MYIFALLILSFSCSLFNPQSRSYHIDSNPSSTIKLITSKDQEGVIIGSTPLDIQIDQLNKLSENENWYFLKLERNGYVTENLIIEKKSNLRTFELKMKPVEWWNDKSSELPSRIAQQIGSTVKEIYRLIRNGSFDDALLKVDLLIKEYPSTAIFYDIQGSLFVLDNQIDLAISSYEKSIKLAPTNKETMSILGELKKDKKKR
jgi:hypothetical protein